MIMLPGVAWSTSNVYISIRKDQAIVRSNPNPYLLTSITRFELLDHKFFKVPAQEEGILINPVGSLLFSHNKEEKFTHFFVNGYMRAENGIIGKLMPVDADDEKNNWLCYDVVCFENNCRYLVNFVDPKTNDVLKEGVEIFYNRYEASENIDKSCHEAADYWMDFSAFRKSINEILRNLTEKEKLSEKIQQWANFGENGYVKVFLPNGKIHKLMMKDRVFGCLNLPNRKVNVVDRKFLLKISKVM